MCVSVTERVCVLCVWMMCQVVHSHFGTGAHACIHVDRERAHA